MYPSDVCQPHANAGRRNCLRAVSFAIAGVMLPGLFWPSLAATVLDDERYVMIDGWVLPVADLRGAADA